MDLGAITAAYIRPHDSRRLPGVAEAGPGSAAWQHTVEIRPYDLPPACAERCHDLAAAIGLAIAGLDLRRGGDGEWYCFKVNPSPGFTYYQEATGQPFDQAIASHLAAGAP